MWISYYCGFLIIQTIIIYLLISTILCSEHHQSGLNIMSLFGPNIMLLQSQQKGYCPKSDGITSQLGILGIYHMLNPVFVPHWRPSLPPQTVNFHEHIDAIAANHELLQDERPPSPSSPKANLDLNPISPTFTAPILAKPNLADLFLGRTQSWEKLISPARYISSSNIK